MLFISILTRFFSLSLAGDVVMMPIMIVTDLINLTVTHML